MGGFQSRFGAVFMRCRDRSAAARTSGSMSGAVVPSSLAATSWATAMVNMPLGLDSFISTARPTLSCGRKATMVVVPTYPPPCHNTG